MTPSQRVRRVRWHTPGHDPLDLRGGFRWRVQVPPHVRQLMHTRGEMKSPLLRYTMLYSRRFSPT